MNNALPAPQVSAYNFTEGLREPFANECVHNAPPHESEREELLIQKLGVRGWGRIHQFRYYYGQGWGEARLPSLSPRALDAFFRFLEVVTFPNGVQPSVFLTDEGGLELLWEDKQGKKIQVVFGAQNVEFYKEAPEEDSSLDFSKLPDLARQLSA